MGVALAFGLAWQPALFVGLTLTATAVAITLKILQDLGLQQTGMARLVVAACMVDDLLTLLFVTFLLNLLTILGLKGCALMLAKENPEREEAT